MHSTDSRSVKPRAASGHITVCVCTFKRPAALERLLLALDRQCTRDAFTFSAVVVDNDARETARETVARVSARVQYTIIYDVEARQNIALARNKALLHADGDFIATIDDDEVPDPDWLYQLFQTLQSSNADGVFGPVRPFFSPEAPQWLIRSGLCDRDSYVTGTILTRNHPLRTGNTLLRRRIFNGGSNLFEEEFGRTGGEDSEFFDKRIAEGFWFVWCEEAVAHEEVPPERCTFSFQVKRLIRSGAQTGEKMRLGNVPFWSNFLKSLAASVFHAVMLPIYALGGRHCLAARAGKLAYHVSRLLGIAGIVLFRHR